LSGLGEAGNTLQKGFNDPGVNQVLLPFLLNGIIPFFYPLACSKSRRCIGRAEGSCFESVLDLINQLSVQFQKTFDGKKVKSDNPTHKEALLYLLLSQTSCFRYWREDLWTDYPKEICRRGLDLLKCS
jgi:hypothetical protein